MLYSMLIAQPRGYVNFLPHLPLRSPKKAIRVMPISTHAGHSQSLSSSSSSSLEEKSPLAVVLDVPRFIWRQTLKPLTDFGFGKQQSNAEGGVGLFLASGAVLLVLCLAWLRGLQFRSKFSKYFAVFEFDQACGISMGTPVRIRGVTVGNVIRVNPSLTSIEAIVEVEDDQIIIPQNSLVEANQSGLLMETLIDITPQDPIPTPSVGPLHGECLKEGLIVCDKQKIKGYQGVSLDALIRISTRLGREMEEIGVFNSYSLAERVTAVIVEAKPVLTEFGSDVVMSQIKAIAEVVQPLLADIRDTGLLKEVKNLTRSLTQASENFRRAQTSITNPENTELIQKSIYSLIVTLENIENISSDILRLTGDEPTRRNLKALIKSLSRML